MFGPTPTGFIRKTFDQIYTDIKDAIRGQADKRLTLDAKDPIGAMLQTLADRFGVSWENIESAYNSFDEDQADGFAAVNLAALTGTERNPAQKGLVTATLGLDANKTFAAGALIAHVVGEPDNRWVNTNTVASVAAGDYAAEFESESTGADKIALAGTLTVIAAPAGGWNDITNAADAQPGKDLETIPDLLIRRKAEVALQGVDGPALAASQVDGVISTRLFFNDTNQVDIDGLLEHSIRVVVWDGAAPAADDDELAQAILDVKVEGIRTNGAASGTARDRNGEDRTIKFDRATQVQLFCDVSVDAPDGADTDDIKAAIIATISQDIGALVPFAPAQAAPLSVDGVTDVTSFTLDIVDPPLATASLQAAADEVFNLDSVDIDVTINP